ncbi:TPA: hypothetical protein HA361_05620 [Candidatus Woesearchaeota archaeon]|nr:hypothetical protein [Candidatus Woesearchaeota archaeon]
MRYGFVILSMLFAVVLIPSALADEQPTPLQQAQVAADEFVARHGIFYHGPIRLKILSLQRTTLSLDVSRIAFLYQAKAKTEQKELFARFIVTVRQDPIGIISVQQLKDGDPPVAPASLRTGKPPIL